MDASPASGDADEGNHKTEDSSQQLPAVQGWQVCQWLLANNYLVSGLELLVEAQEVGREQDVEALQHFFSDSGKFPPEELAKYDREDAMDLQRMAKEREERLAIAEYELRIAKEDMLDLQACLSPDVARVSQGDQIDRLDAASDGASGSKEAAAAHSLEQGPVRDPSGNELPFKDRIHLNAAVRHYLAQCGYKLTALTFLEEAADAIPRGAMKDTETLMSFYTGFRQQETAIAAAEEAVSAKSELQQRAERVEARLQGLQESLDAMLKENTRLRSDAEFQQRKLDWLSEKLQEAEHNENQARRAAKENGLEASAAPLQSDSGSAARAHSQTPSMEESHADAVLAAVADALPKFVPHMLINARVELLPLFMTLIQELKNPQARDTLAHAMFNIVKKPTAGQRLMIADAMEELAQNIGPGRTAEELLPQCWEQVAHKHAERRIVVAECCGRLAPLVAADMRPSLVLSMLQQLAADTDAGVQKSVAASLALLLPHLADLSKYSAVEAILLDLVLDSPPLVQEAVDQQLVPALLAWTEDSDLLHASLLPAVLSAALKVLQQCPVLAGANEDAVKRGEAELRVVGDQQQRQVQALLRFFVSLLGPLQKRALAARPEWAYAGTAAKAAPISPISNSLAGLHPTASDQDFSCASSTVTGADDSLAAPVNRLGHMDMGARADADSEAGGASESQGQEATTTASIADSFDDPLGALTSQVSRSEAGGPGRAAAQGSEVDGSQAGTPKGTATAGSEAAELRAGPEGNLDGGAGHINLGSVPSKQDQDASSGRASEADSAAFATWLAAESPADWAMVQWVVTEAIPLLLRIMRMVPAQEQTESLRRRQCVTLKTVCTTFGEHFTSVAILPLFMTSATLAAYLPEGATSAAVASAAEGLTPQGSEAGRVGRLCVLPQLLAAVLPCSGAGALAQTLRSLMMDASDEEAWALSHPTEMASALRFASAFEELQGQLLALVWELIAKPNAAAKMCAAELAGAIAPCLSLSLVKRQVLPALLKLTNDAELGVKALAIEALAKLWQLFSNSSSSLEKLHRHLDTIMSCGVHEVELALVKSLASKAGAVNASQLEYVLQKVLLLLASMHQRAAGGRSPLQLQAGATVIFDALRQIAACQVGEQTVALHLLAALQALRREAELLDPHQREQLDQLTKQQAAATPAMSLPERAARPSPFQPQEPRQPQGRQQLGQDPGSLMSNGDRGDLRLPGATELRSITSPAGQTGRREGRSQSSSGAPHARVQGSRELQGSAQKAASSVWRDSGRALFRSVSGKPGGPP